ncbi:MAG: hypothetical protein O7D95_05730, partial [Betaproteobacteria bacterium]|nr:hypothetical protein [Betaproteobacteria bacterium]
SNQIPCQETIRVFLIFDVSVFAGDVMGHLNILGIDEIINIIILIHQSRKQAKFDQRHFTK